MKKFEDFTADPDRYFDEYFRNELCVHFFFQRPGAAVDDLTRQGQRLFQIVEVAASYTGLNFYVKTAKYAYMGKEIFQMLINGQVLKTLGPVAGAMGDLVAKELGPTSKCWRLSLRSSFSGLREI